MSLDCRQRLATANQMVRPGAHPAEVQFVCLLLKPMQALWCVCEHTLQTPQPYKTEILELLSEPEQQWGITHPHHPITPRQIA